MIFLTKVTKKRRKRKKKHIAIRILNIILTIIVGGMIYSFGVASYENVQVTADVKAFKARATEEISVDLEYSPGVIQKRVYHIVPRETSYELEDTRSVFYNDNPKYLGQTGDIFTTQQSPFPGSFGVHQFVTYYFGGHAAIKSAHNTFYEATGMTTDPSEIWAAIKDSGENESELTITASETSSNHWLYPKYRTESSEDYPYYGTYYRKEFFGLRVKNITEEQLQGVVAFGETANDTYLYNYLFFLDLKYKYYCTDFVSRAYQKQMTVEENQKNYSTVLNDDGFITSVNDLILSNDTYLIFYVEIIDEVVHIYHLEDI